MKIEFIDPKTVERIKPVMNVDKIVAVVGLFNDKIICDPDCDIWIINNSIDDFKLLNNAEFANCCNLAKQKNMELSQKSDNYQTTMYTLKLIK